MSRIIGDLGEIVTSPALRPVGFRALSKTVVLSTGRIIVPSSVATQTDSSGKVDVFLVMGDYEVTCGEAKFIVSIPDDNNTYPLYQRIVSAVVYAPTTPVGGAQPNASASVFGLVKTNSTDAAPVVYLKSEIDSLLAGMGGGGGARVYDTLAALKAATVPPNGTEVILTGLSAADDLIAGEGRVRRYLYRSASTATANDGAVVQPTAGGGRYIQI